jgi:hypothetical protein
MSNFPEMTKDTRKDAWLLMLGIDEDGEEYAAHKELYDCIVGMGD